jgi:hypothetical protein
MRGNSLVPFLEGLEAVTPPGYSALGGGNASRLLGGRSEKGCAQIPPVGDRQVKARSGTSPAPYPTNDVQRESAKPSPDMAFGLFRYVPLHNICDGIKRSDIFHLNFYRVLKN